MTKQSSHNADRYNSDNDNDGGGEERFPCTYCGKPIKRYPNHLPKCERTP